MSQVSAFEKNYWNIRCMFFHVMTALLANVILTSYMTRIPMHSILLLKQATNCRWQIVLKMISYILRSAPCMLSTIHFFLIKTKLKSSFRNRVKIRLNIFKQLVLTRFQKFTCSTKFLFQLSGNKGIIPCSKFA